MLAPGEDECAECRAKRAGGTAVLARDELRPGDTAPQDDVDRAAGGRARSNTLFGRQCEPYENPWWDPHEALRNQAAMLTLVPAAVYATTLCTNLAPDYDNDAFTVGANLAGGLGSSDAGPDSRSFDGRVTFDKTPRGGLCDIQARFEFDWHVLDGVDFCPGNAGNVFQEALTIPMSRLEASGIAKDVGIDVRFRRVRYDTPRTFPNPDADP